MKIKKVARFTEFCFCCIQFNKPIQLNTNQSKPIQPKWQIESFQKRLIRDMQLDGFPLCECEDIFQTLGCFQLDLIWHYQIRRGLGGVVADVYSWEHMELFAACHLCPCHPSSDPCTYNARYEERNVPQKIPRVWVVWWTTALVEDVYSWSRGHILDSPHVYSRPSCTVYTHCLIWLSRCW